MSNFCARDCFRHHGGSGGARGRGDHYIALRASLPPLASCFAPQAMARGMNGAVWGQTPSPVRGGFGVLGGRIFVSGYLSSTPYSPSRLCRQPPLGGGQYATTWRYFAHFPPPRGGRPRRGRGEYSERNGNAVIGVRLLLTFTSVRVWFIHNMAGQELPDAVEACRSLFQGPVSKEW